MYWQWHYITTALQHYNSTTAAVQGKAVLAAATAGKTVTEMVEQFGKACGLPGSFQVGGN